MVDIKTALDIALIRANMTRVELVMKLEVSDSLIRYVARGQRNSPRVRKYLEDFCKKHAPEDYGRALQEDTEGASNEEGKPHSQGERPGTVNGRLKVNRMAAEINRIK